jgi:hypothetical protein
MDEPLISPDDPEFQLGRYLYDTQVIFADLQKGPVAKERLEQLCRRYCRLINLTGMLRMECERLQEKVK